MCVSIASERGAARYINAYLSGLSRPNDSYPAHLLEQFQSYQGWLKDYEIRDCRLVLKVTGKPGVQALNKAIDQELSVPTYKARQRERVA